MTVAELHASLCSYKPEAGTLFDHVMTRATTSQNDNL
jgi:hypothetical protein